LNNAKHISEIVARQIVLDINWQKVSSNKTKQADYSIKQVPVQAVRFSIFWQKATTCKMLCVSLDDNHSSLNISNRLLGGLNGKKYCFN
jgi:hypothetical protein